MRRNDVPALQLLILSELWFYIPKGYGPADNNRLVSVLACLWLGVVFMKKRNVARGMIITAILLYGYLEHTAVAGLPLRADPFKLTPVIDKLKKAEGIFRICGLDTRFMPNYAGVYGIQDIRYINSLTPSANHHFYNSVLLSKPLRSYRQLWFAGIADSDIPYSEDVIRQLKLYSWLGVRYIITALRTRLPLPIVYADDHTNIYENPDYLPRTYMVYHTIPADNYRAAQRLLMNPEIDLYRLAIIEKALNLTAADDAEWKTDIIRYEPNRVEINVATNRRGLLVLTDSFYRGWNVTIDGRQEELLRVNGLVRGVVLSAGTHTVVFRYWPRTFLIGCLLAFGGCIWYAAAIVRWYRTVAGNGQPMNCKIQS